LELVVRENVPELDRRGVAYLVKTWPRLSETFILNEVIAVERLGAPLRIFSVKPPDPGPVHTRVREVRARVTYLDLPRNWRAALPANVRSLVRQPRQYARTLLEALVQAVRHRSLAAPRHFLKAGYLADLLFREPVAHLHAHFATAPGLVAMYASQLTGVPYSLTAHAKDIYVNRPENLRTRLERARVVATCTEYNRQYLLTHFGPECGGKLHRIYHGLDLSQFPFRPFNPPGPRPPLVLSVARLVEKKGLRDLIEAADILRRRGRRFRVEIIGTGPLRESLEAQVSGLGLKFQVRLLGAQTHEKVCEAYRRASVFALPCVVTSNGDRDGIPNVLVEAMASGTPVVSTPVSGIPELIESERDGLLVEPNSPQKLAEALDRLLSDPGLGGRLARAARAKIEARFSAEEGARRLLELFQCETQSPRLSLEAAPEPSGASVAPSEVR
jgi:glycosyltransferase involved in cell wall biosynthesis